MTISLRNLPPDIEKAIMETSRSEEISLNKATLTILEQALKKTAKISDFDEFAGTWSTAESDEFEAALKTIWGIDPKQWSSTE